MIGAIYSRRAVADTPKRSVDRIQREVLGVALGRTVDWHKDMGGRMNQTAAEVRSHSQNRHENGRQESRVDTSVVLAEAEHPLHTTPCGWGILGWKMR